MVELRQWQGDALKEVYAAWRHNKRPVIQAVMGAGKSYVIAEIARQVFRRGSHAVVTVPTQALVEQLAQTYEQNTGQPAGRFYADVKDIYPVTFVCHPSLAAYETARRAWLQERDLIARQSTDGEVIDEEWPSRFWIADECHKTECDTVHDWLETVELEHRVGLTATPWRAEESESIQAFDSVVYTYTAQDAHRDGHIVKPTVHHAESAREYVKKYSQKYDWHGREIYGTRVGHYDIQGVDQLSVHWVKMQAGGGVCNSTSISDAEDFRIELDRAGLDAIAVHSNSDYDATDAKAHIVSGGVVVYVDMLSEGFDCPDIRWMVMRRPVKSRVRFAQEVGRGLRAAPGKDTCHVLDVYDLFNTHSLDWRACVGEVDQREVVPHLKLVDFLKTDGCTGEQVQMWPNEKMPPEYLRPVRSFIRSTRVAMQFDGRIDLAVESTHWRSDPVSRKQWHFIHRLMNEKASKISHEERGAYAAAYYGLSDAVRRHHTELSGAMRKGDAADFISILKGI